jgi:hypothetical protein
MGWSVGWKTRKELIGFLTSPTHFSSDYTLIKNRVVGNNIWSLIRRPDGSATITLDMIKAFPLKGQPTEWGYKGLDESALPCEVNCPLSLLNATNAPPNEHAIEWREKVRAYHAERKARPVYAAGQYWRYGSALYRLTAPGVVRRGWIVMAIDTAEQFFMSYHQLKRAELVVDR